MNNGRRQMQVAVVLLSGILLASAGEVSVHLTKAGTDLAGQTLYLFDGGGRI